MKANTLCARITICYFMLMNFFVALKADTIGLISSPLVNHPIQHPINARSAYLWRTHVGSWGEKLVEESFRLRGFDEIYEIKSGGNHGVDRIAIKRGANGVINDLRFAEVKTTRSSKPRLNRTRYGGMQMSRKWLAENLRKMRNSGDQNLRKLAVEVSRFRRTTGSSIESLGEVVHVNTKTGRLTAYSPNDWIVKYDEPLERVVKRIKRETGARQVRKWASQSLKFSNEIKSESMSSWLGKNVAQQSRGVLLGTSSGSISNAENAALRTPFRAMTKKILRRAAGPLALVVSLAIDAKELYDVEYSYRNGTITARQRYVRMASTLGGAAGAFAGASAGGTTGAWLGALGGPAAWITVPVGGILGGALGGFGGYLGGSTIAEYGVKSWYKSVDASVLEKFELAWLAMQAPAF